MTKTIDSVSAWVMVDPADDTEGICGFLGKSGTWIPLIAADEARLVSLRPIARDLAQATGRPVRLLRFLDRQEVEVLDPEPPIDKTMRTV